MEILRIAEEYVLQCLSVSSTPRRHMFGQTSSKQSHDTDKCFVTFKVLQFYAVLQKNEST